MSLWPHSLESQTTRPIGRSPSFPPEDSVRHRTPRPRLALAVTALGVGGLLLVGPGAGIGGAAAGDGPITGTVYRDLVGDGGRDGSDPGQSGVTVTVTDAAGASASAISAADGGYSVATTGLGAGPFRVQFSGWAAHLRPAPHGSGNPSSVTVAAAGATVDFGVWDPSDYCQANPTMAVTCFVSGEAEASLETIATFPYSAGTTETSDHYGSGPAGYDQPQEVRAASLADTGSIYGEGWHARSSTLYAASFAKRFVPFGSAGSDVIYRQRNGTTAVFFDGGSATDRTPPGDDWYLDPWRTEITKVGWGDVDVVGNRLFAVNLEDRKLYVFDLDPATGDRVGDGPVASVEIPPVAQVPADSRPFALGSRDGLLYVGGVDSAESTGATPQAWVQSFNPVTNAFAATVSTFSLGFDRGCSYVFPTFAGRCSLGYTANWRAWGATPSATEWPNFNGLLDVNSVTRFEINPQPILADIAFDDDGDMVLGFRDRHGDQAGRLVPAGTIANPINAAWGQVPLLLDSYSFGDTLRLDRTAAGWTLESNGTSGGVTGTAGSQQGPGGGEFYDADNSLYIGDSGLLEGHDEVTMGGLYHHRASGETASTAYDVFGKWDLLGIRWMGNAGDDAPQGADSTSLGTRAYGLYRATPGSPVPFGKANGLGDLEALCASAPLELGNFVWFDADADGVQDPDERPIPGVTVRLLDGAGATLATAVTDAGGRYWFVSSGAPNLPAAPGPAYGIVAAGIGYDTAYSIAFDPSTADVTGLGVANAAALTLTGRDQGTNDAVDSDPTPAGGVGAVSLTTGGPGANDHTFDAGYGAPRVLGSTTTITSTTSTTVPVSVQGTTTIPLNAGAPLAATGSRSDDLSLVGLGLVLLGAGLLVSSGRRRTAPR